MKTLAILLTVLAACRCEVRSPGPASPELPSPPDPPRAHFCELPPAAALPMFVGLPAEGTARLEFSISDAAELRRYLEADAAWHRAAEDCLLRGTW